MKLNKDNPNSPSNKALISTKQAVINGMLMESPMKNGGAAMPLTSISTIYAGVNQFI